MVLVMSGAILYIMLVHVLCGRLWYWLWVVLFCILCLYMYCVVGYGTGYGWCYSVYYACICIMW